MTIFMAAIMKCRSCGAPIRWAKTRHNRAMPLDAEKVEGGNVVLAADGFVDVVKPPVPEGTVAYRSHFQTCPNAAEHRNR